MPIKSVTLEKIEQMQKEAANVGLQNNISFGEFNAI